MKSRVFGSLSTLCREEKQTRDLVKREEVHGNEIDEITQRFNKEMSELRTQLAETQKNLQQVHVTKESMQDNLKKAFMRGVCALNFEAMNVIQGAGGSQSDSSSFISSAMTEPSRVEPSRASQLASSSVSSYS